jgi:hypothetical protein
MSLTERFWAKVEKTDECWLWTGALVTGYGQIAVSDGQRATAHRLSWEWENGPIPEGLQVNHHCDMRACVRPSHLYLGTQEQNMRDKMERGRWKGGHGQETHCPQGHPYEGHNLILNSRRQGRMCRTCKNAGERRRRASRS